LTRLVAGRCVTPLNRLDVADECALGRLASRPLTGPYLDPQPLALVARRALDPLAILFAQELQASIAKLID
jgi:DNA-binding transcriptional LysR family regulator